MTAARVDHSQAPEAFAEDIEAFLGFISLERGLAKNTIAGYRRDLDQAGRFLARHGAKNWRSVTGENAAAWIHALSSARYTVASLARKLTALRMLARFLVREKFREDDFTALLTGPKLARKMPAVLSEEEVARLLDAPGDGGPRALRDRALLELFYSSGLRVSELAALRLQQIDLDHGFIRVFGKGSKERVVPVGGRACDALKTYLLSGRPHLVKAKTGSEFFLNNRGGALSPRGALDDREAAGEARRHHEERQAPRAAAFLCDAPAHRRRRSPGDSGNARAREHLHYANLHRRGTPAAPQPPREISPAQPGEIDPDGVMTGGGTYGRAWRTTNCTSSSLSKKPGHMLWPWSRGTMRVMVPPSAR